LLFVCYVKQVATNDGWLNALQACKVDGSRKRLDKDKKGSSKEEGHVCFWFKLLQFGEKVELARIYSCCVVFLLR
jgi:hypothetical protein